MPSESPWGGNFAGSVIQRPYASTLGPCGPGHWYQKSSRFTYWYPSSCNPELWRASAWALILSAVGSFRMKLQLLQPRTGVRSRPLSSAVALGRAPANNAISSAAVKLCVDSLEKVIGFLYHKRVAKTITHVRAVRCTYGYSCLL